MIVKEVEIYNTMQIAGTDVSASAKSGLHGYLSNNADTLTIKAPTFELKAGYARVFRLDYVNVDLNNSKLSYEELLTSEAFTEWLPGSEVVFDITKVKDIVKYVDTTTGSLDEYTVRYKYLTDGAPTIDLPEVELKVRYGFPLLEIGDAYAEYVNTIDGWYQLIVLDIPIWSDTIKFMAGDLTVSADGVTYKCLVDNTITTALDVDTSWEVASSDTFQDYATIPYNTEASDNQTKKLVSDIMITYDIKHKYVFPLINNSSFMPHDDDITNKALLHISALREAVKAYLELGDLIGALYTLRTIPGVYNSYTKPNTLKKVTNPSRYII